MPATWSRAWGAASREFWARELPSRHFATSAGSVLAERMAAIALSIDERLGRPDDMTIIDLGAGDGALIAHVRAACPQIAERATWIAVDLRPIRKEGVTSLVKQVPGVLPHAPFSGLVMAHEWLDEIPCDVVERDQEGVDRLVLVGPSGEELGPSLDDDDACAAYDVDAAMARAWLRRWWPLERPGDRAEVGWPRDEAWAWMTGLIRRGVALATDYGHTEEERRHAHAVGTLRGYRHGRGVPPAIDGSVGVTADVAVDACAARVPGTTISMQRDELASARTGERRTREVRSPQDLQRHFEALRVSEPAGLGGFRWLRWEAW